MSSRPLDRDERAQLDALVALGDNEIDTVDIPELSEEQWAGARRGAFGKPSGLPEATFIEDDVVEWFKKRSADGGYQAEINRVLRQYVVDAERKQA